MPFRPCLQNYIPQANGPLLSLRVCMYTNTPDFHFIIDQHPLHKNVTLACGFSGHGFKFATAIGEVLADLSTTGQTPHPIEFLSLKRFQNP
jgi:glycine/D-amino acid oxidase-like deaminating enzyme